MVSMREQSRDILIVSAHEKKFQFYLRKIENRLASGQFARTYNTSVIKILSL